MRHDEASGMGALDETADMAAPAAPDAALMRRLRGRFPAGVTVVTMRTDEGLRGVTVSSFTTVSLSPPLVLVCLGRDVESEALLPEVGAFGVSVLSDRQEFLSERFAGRGPLVDGTFAGVPYHTRVTGAPLLDGAAAWFDCRLHAYHEGGDHTIFVGRVVWAAEDPAAPLPLVHYAQMYATLDNLRRP